MNMRRFIFFLIVCEFFSLACIAANKTIKGHIVDEFGKNVEFASVYVDSIYAVSDKEGKFSLVVPDGMKQELVISHISYQTSKIPYDVYSKNPPHAYFSVRMGERCVWNFMHFARFYSFISFMFAGL